MFHYFLPGVTQAKVAPGDKLDRDVLASFGLGEVLADMAVCPADATVVEYKPAPGRGPGPLAGHGVLIAPTRKYASGPMVLLDANLQSWRPAIGGKHWLGFSKSEKLGPRNLERKKLVAGDDVADRNGNVWIVPIARAPSHAFGTLPQSYTFDEAGQPVPQLVPDYQWLWDLSGEIQDWYRQFAPQPEGDETKVPAAARIPFERLVQYAARILGVNYRLGLSELNALHEAGVAVLDNSTASAICQATFGWQIEDEAKKKPLAGQESPAGSSLSSSTGDGTLGDAPGIDPVEEP